MTGLLLAILLRLPVAAAPVHDLWNALMAEDFDAAQTALDNGADINAVAQDFADDDDPENIDISMLILAIAEDASIESLTWLLEHGADIHYTIPAGEFKGASALFVADYFGYDEAAQLLKDAGAALSEEELRLKEYMQNVSMQDCSRSMLQTIEELIEEFQELYGFYPKVPEGKKSFDVLSEIWEYRTLQGETLQYRWSYGDNCWGTPIHYQSEDGATYALTSYGSDTAPGGSGEFEADIVVSHHKEPVREPLILSDVLPAATTSTPEKGKIVTSPSKIAPQESSDEAEGIEQATTVSQPAQKRLKFDPANLPGVWDTYKIPKDTLLDEQAVVNFMASLESGEKTFVDILGAEEMRRIPPGTTEFLESGEVKFAVTDYMTYDTLLYLQVTGTWQSANDNALTVHYTSLDEVKMTLTDDVSEASKTQRQPELDEYAVRFKEKTVSDPEFSRPRTLTFLSVGETYWLVDMEDHRSYFVYRCAQETSLNPEEISNVIVTIYHDAITELADVVKGYPEPADLEPVLEKLKAGYIKQLVKLGEQRESLTQEEKARLDGATWLHISKVPEEAYQIYKDAIDHYFEIDQDTWELLRSFNIITQYAFFELLKKQEPEEAKRLGIE